MERITESGTSTNGKSGPKNSRRKSIRCVTKKRLSMSHGALNNGIRPISSLGKLGLIQGLGKLMTGITLIGLILRTSRHGAGMMPLGSSGLTLSKEHSTKFMIVFLKAGNIGMKKTSVTGYASSILRTGKVMTGRSSTGLTLKTMTKKTLITGLIATGWVGLTGNRICLKNAKARMSTAITRSIIRISWLNSKTGLFPGSRIFGTVKMTKTWTGNLSKMKIGKDLI